MGYDILYWQFDIFLRGVIDLQLIQFAAAGSGRQYPLKLEACMLQDLNISDEEREMIRRTKARGRGLWNQKYGDKLERSNDNPLREDIFNYCVIDTAYLPKLFERYNACLDDCVHVMNIDTL